MILFQRFVTDDEGSTAIEYGMLSIFVFLTILVAVQQFATSTVELWTNLATHMGT